MRREAGSTRPPLPPAPKATIMEPVNENACPSEERLRALTRGRLSEADAAPLAEHVASCRACRGLVDLLAADIASDRLPPRVKSGVESPALGVSSKHFVALVGFGAALLVVFLLFYRRDPTPPSTA